MKTLRHLAFVTAGFAYGVIVIGFIVRITGSGMGCGPDWPLCNGQVIPTFTGPDVVIEWTHRLAVVGLSLLTTAVVVVAVIRRDAAGGSGPGGTLRPAGLAFALLIIQSFLGRQAVKLELEAWVVVAHLGLALALLATLIVIGLRSGTPAPTQPPQVRGHGGILAAGALGAAVIVLGGLTANLGAGPACLGFPLCSGQWWPTAASSGLAHVHWTHRLLAYAILFHLLGLAMLFTRHRAPAPVRTTAWVVFGIAATQALVAVVMVLSALPPVWRGLHAAVGTALWVALVYYAWIGRYALGATPSPS